MSLSHQRGGANVRPPAVPYAPMNDGYDLGKNEMVSPDVGHFPETS